MYILISFQINMCNKNRWINNNSIICTLKKECSDVNIMWSTSESENEEERQRESKKTKRFSRSKIRRINPIKVNISERNVTVKEISKNTTPQDSSLCLINEGELSPVLSFEALQQKSPTIKQTYDDLQMSPVIGRHKTAKNNHVKCDNKKSYNSKNCSSIYKIERDKSYVPQILGHIDVVQSQSNYVIDQTFSEEPEEYIHISQYSTDSEPKSSHLQCVNIIDVSSSGSSNFTLSLSVNECEHKSDILHNRTKRKRKKVKKGLSTQLQKALSASRAATAIWKHELYLHKLNQYELDEIDYVTLKVLAVRLEFHQYIVDCIEVKCSNAGLIEGISSTTFNDSGSDDSNKCLVINEELYTRSKLVKIFMPYNTRDIFYNNRSILCYYNVTKILFL